MSHKKDEKEERFPCKIPQTGVFQSPIKLKFPSRSVFESQLTFRQPRTPITYEFNRETEDWDVTNRVRLVHNQERYRLERFHAHLPGEHVINGIRFPVEMHVVFTNPRSILVVALMTTLHKHHTSKLWKRLLSNRSIVLPSFRWYWSYSGSLTTPPFGVNVTWIVASRVLHITARDFRRLATIESPEPPRPLQPRHGRNIIFAENGTRLK